ncbi:MAG: SPOR domain-containing protein [Xanthomonadales bacterium]|nr:SPOR domain-containing protein [Xanthomonadales bacterium]
MDVALKQRLVGATVLIALAVIVLPMLLSGRPEDAAEESQKIELPPQPAELDFQTRRYPIGEAATAEPRAAAPAAEPSPGALTHVEVEPRNFEDALGGDGVSDGAPTESPLPTVQEPPPAKPGDTGPESVPGDASTKSAEPAVPTPEPVAPLPAGGGGRYAVQVASFGSLDNANRLSDTLRGHGYAVLSDTVASDVGTLHRVRVGPYETETSANQAVSRLRQQVEGVGPRVVDLQPEVSAPATVSSDPLVRWVVQVGSFSSTGNADKLVDRLRAEGLSAYKEAVSSSGSTIYRVRAGPYVERDEAIRVQGRVRERLSLDGVVMSAD